MGRLPRRFSKGSFSGISLILLTALWLAFPAAGFAGTYTVFGPKDYLRASGKPETVTDSFTVQAPGGTYTLFVYNGGLPERFSRVSSALISLNGTQVFGPSDFKSKIGILQKAVSLSASNSLKVTVQSNPESGLTITIVGTDNDPPVIRATPDPPPNAAGWNNTSVTVRFECSDALSGIATCPAPIVVSDEGANQVISGTATDRAGNTATASVTLSIDRTPPTISAAPDPSANPAGWNRTDVTVRFTAGDSLSGIATVTPAVNLTNEGAGQAATGTAVDKAGNSASATATVSIDKTPPIIQVGVSPAPNANDWINEDATVAFDCSDGLSGVAACPGPVVVSTEGERQAVAGTAADRAGNIASTGTTVNIDKTPPQIAAATEPAPSLAGWNRTDVTVHFTATDALSGMETVTDPVTVATEGADQEVEGSAQDRAGNTARATATVSIDRTPPAILAGVSPAPNANGWINRDATVAFECSDGLSGVATCPAPVEVATEGEGQAVGGTAIDNAGNAASAGATVSIDKTPPQVAAAAEPAPNPAGWNRTDVTVRFTAIDALSGVAAVTDPVVVATEGADQEVEGSAQDRAGNTASAATLVSIDKTPPIIHAAVSPAPNANGWIDRDATVAFECSDGLSGVATCPVPVEVATEGEDQVVGGTAMDAAGNAASAGATVSIDRTPPTIQAALSPEPNAGGWNKSDVTVTFTAADDLSGLSDVTLPILVTQEGAGRVVSGTATDRAGLSADLDVSVNLDKTSPLLHIASPASGSITAAESITVTGIVEDANLAGVSVNGVPAVLGGGAFVAAGVPLAAGSNVITATAIDLAGNTSDVVAYVTRDTTAPVVRLTAPGEVLAGGELQLSAEATDPEGIVSVAFYVDGNLVATVTETPYEAVFHVSSDTPPGAVLEVEARALDAAGLESSDAAMVRVIAAQIGSGVIAGVVLDDTTGLPIEGALIDLESLDGQPPSPAMQTASDRRGRFRVAGDPGTARLTIAKGGFTGVERTVDFVAGKRTDPLDARLTPLDAVATDVVSVIGGTIRNGAGDSALVVSPGALSDDRQIRLTRFGAQGLIAPLPSGWSPVAGVEISPGDLIFGIAGTLSVTAPEALPDGASLVVARWDGLLHAWVAKGTFTRSGGKTQLEATVVQAGQYVWLLPDAAPLGPPSPVIDTPVPGLLANPPPLDPTTVSAAILPSPKILFTQPGARARVAVQVTPPAPAPSGTPFAFDLAESYDFPDGGRLALEPAAPAFTLYAFPPAGGPLNLGSTLTVTPSRAFAPFALRQGVIDLAGRLPESPRAPRGTVIGSDGGVASEAEAPGQNGARLVVPGGATDGPLPVLLAALGVDQFPLPVPAGLSLLGAVGIDLHGGGFTRAATLSIPAPPGLAADAQVLLVRIVEVNDVGYLALAGAAALQGGRLVVVTDPKGDGSLRLPGVRDEGRYAFLRADAPLGFVTGTAYDRNGQPLPGALVSVDTLPIVSLADADGRYVLAAPVGDFQVTGADPASGDVFTRAGTIADRGSVASSDLPLAAPALQVVSVTPAGGAHGVPLESGVTVGFSRPVDPVSVAADAFVVTTGGAPVAGSVSVAPGGRSVTFHPAALLLSQSAYVVTVAGTIKDQKGNALGAPFVSQFTTLDITPPPRPPAGSITATIPDETGVSIVSGTQGTAEPGGTVSVRNLRTGALTTFTPNADGSFSGTVVAARADRLELIIRDPAGNATTLPLGPFRNPDGSTVVGSEGGHVEGAGGAFVDAPAGALPDGTVVKVEPLLPSDLALDPPDGFPFVAGVHLDLGGVLPSRPLHIGVQAPPGLSADDQILVAQVIQTPRRLAWTVVDRGHVQEGMLANPSSARGTVTGGASSILADGGSAPQKEGSFSFLKVDGACISFVTISYRFELNILMTVSGLPFVYPSVDVQIVTLPAHCDQPFTISVLDPNTDLVLQQINASAPADRGSVGQSPDVLTSDKTRPIIIGASDPTSYQVDEIEIRFSKPMDEASVKRGFQVEDGDGNAVAGDVEMREGSTVAVFRPKEHFRLGEQYSVFLFGVKDQAGNFLEGRQIKFTPFTPQTLSHVGLDTLLREALKKCTSDGACSTSAIDEVNIGNTLFMANGLRFANENYADPASPRRLVVADVTDPYDPGLIGTNATATNPRALAAVPAVQFTLPNGSGFSGDMLLVAGGGHVPGGELDGKLEIYDVSTCTKRLLPPTANCLNPSLQPLKRYRLLSTAAGTPARPGVPAESGVPLQMATLHQKTSDQSATLVAYVLVIPLGLEAVDVRKAFESEQAETQFVGPDGILRGDFLDVAVLQNRVLAIEQVATSISTDFVLSVLGADLSRVPAPDTGADLKVPMPGPAARLAPAESMVFDLDGDGNLGTAEDKDNDKTAGKDEIFDLAVVSSGPRTEGEGCVAGVPCGELYVVDLSSVTALKHGGTPAIVARIPMPGPAFAVQVDGNTKTAYVEVRGKGLAIVDLGFLLGVLRGDTPGSGLIDTDKNGVDDRILRIISKPDIVATDVKVDTARGIAFVNGASSGVELVQVCNNCGDLSLDFLAPPRPAGNLARERQLLLQHLGAVRAALGATISDPVNNVAMLEQGSGSCLWRGDLERSCRAFTPGSSDHDIEVLVPADKVSDAQNILDAYIRDHADDLEQLGDFTMFAMPREPFSAAELLNGTPMNRSGDASGDLSMGRQMLLLLWLLEGEYVDDPATPQVDFQAGLPSLDAILDKLKGKSADKDPIFTGEPTGIPRLEGYEWSLLQEFNFYKSGVMLRIKGACDADGALNSPSDVDIDAADPIDNFGETGIHSRNCEDELRTVAKAAIRTVLARLVANDAGNLMVLEGRQIRNPPAPQGDLVETRAITRPNYHLNKLCLGVDNVTSPPASAWDYQDKDCGGFEELIMSLAVESVRRNLGIFPESFLPTIFQFYCVKVGRNCADIQGNRHGFIIDSDEAANALIARAIQFIEDSQQPDATRTIFDQTLASDNKLLKNLVAGQPFPFLDQGLGGGPGIAKICEDAGVPGVTADSPRSDLRQCNAAIVAKKLNGTGDAGLDPVDVVKPTQDRKALEKKIGVKRYVKKNLKVRAINRAPHTVPEATLAMYEGDGALTSQYDRKADTQVLGLRGNESRGVANEPDPDTAGRQRPAFPTFFDTQALAGNARGPAARAIVFFLDPDRQIPEAKKKDNQTGFQYYVLNRQNPSAIPPQATLAFAIDNTKPDPLCIDRPPIKFEFTGKPAASSTVPVKDVTVSVEQQVLLTYKLQNLGNIVLKKVRVERDGQLVFEVPKLSPGQSETHTETFIPAQAKRYRMQATAAAVTEEDDSVGPEHDQVYVTATEGFSIFDIKLFDNSNLGKRGHPLSRFLANQDDAGKDVPLRGAVTDGGPEGGEGGLIRIAIKELKYGVLAKVSITDGELSDVNDGIGWLNHGDQNKVLTLDGIEPDIYGEATVFYSPPPVFVRDQHKDDDLPKVERKVKLTVSQSGEGATVKSILLRRPPVFLIHGLFSTRKTWNRMQPLVPDSGLPVNPFKEIKGFDGRFDLFAVGTPFPSAPFAEGAQALEEQIRLALTFYLPGFSIGKIDVVAHSMGAVLTRRLANKFLVVGPDGPTAPDPKNVPFRKLVAIDSPLLGSPLANKIREIREEMPVKVKLDKDYLNVDEGKLTPEIALKAELEQCAVVVQMVGLTPAFYTHGAVEDLELGSPEMQQLEANGIQVPSHHIVGLTTVPDLGVGLPAEALWGALGQFCNLTPDSTTTEATILFQTSVKLAAVVLGPLLGGLEVPTPKVSKGFPLLKLSENGKEALEAYKKFTEIGDKLKEAAEVQELKTVFTFENDRLVESGSQRGGLPVGSPALTFVQAKTDHTEILDDADILVSACLNGNNLVGSVADRNGDGQPDISCRLILLLEADPGSALFVKSATP